MIHFDLVLVSQDGKKLIYQAPAWSDLEEGDIVICDSAKSTGKVLKVETVSQNDKLVGVILEMADETLPLKKIIGKLEYVEMRYLD